MRSRLQRYLWISFVITGPSIWAQLSSSQSLSIEAVVLEQKLCSGQPTMVSRRQYPEGTLSLWLRVQLVYKNGGVKPLIVPLSRNTTIILSGSLNDVVQKKNQTVIPPDPARDLGDLEERGIDLEVPRKPFFDIIPAGTESVGGVEDVGVLVHDPQATSGQIGLLGKTVFLQLELNHLLIPDQLAIKLRRRWSRLGALLTGTVRTQPIELSIPMSPDVSDCSGRFRLD